MDGLEWHTEHRRSVRRARPERYGFCALALADPENAEQHMRDAAEASLAVAAQFPQLGAVMLVNFWFQKLTTFGTCSAVSAPIYVSKHSFFSKIEIYGIIDLVLVL